jgi:hypothetical protein
MAKKSIKIKKSIKKKPSSLLNNKKMIWQLTLGILTLIILTVIIISAIQEEPAPIPAADEPSVDESSSEENVETTTEPGESTADTESQKTVEENKTEDKKSTGGGGGGDSGDEESVPEETWPKCANWFGNGINWEEVTVATHTEGSGPWGLMNDNECTEEIIGDQGVYSCALTFEAGGYVSCAGDCNEGECLPCDDCTEFFSDDSCADTFDNDGDNTIDCADNDCEGQVCTEDSICQDNSCVESCDFEDTDGGLESSVKGTCTGSNGLDYVDICEDNNLIEYFPSTECISACSGIGINCDFGCSEGACLPDPDKECRDFCTGIAKKEPYLDGACIDRHGNTAEITCSVEGYNYESPIPRRCDTIDACCCIGELVIQ